MHGSSKGIVIKCHTKDENRCQSSVCIAERKFPIPCAKDLETGSTQKFTPLKKMDNLRM